MHLPPSLVGRFVDLGVVVQHEVPKFMCNVESAVLWRLLPRNENDWLRPIPNRESVYVFRDTS